MFTGIIELTGVIREASPSAAGLRLSVAAPHWAYRARRGDSVAVNGCCLTAVHDVGDDGLLVFDAIPETLAKTTLGSFSPGLAVNLEHAATASTFLGGHIVQGHVDAVASVTSISTTDGWRVRLAPPREVMPWMIPKGSVCLDGVSLTLAAIDQASGWIEVALIPTTLDKTTLRGWTPGTRVNVEADMMVKTIASCLANMRMA